MAKFIKLHAIEESIIKIMYFNVDNILYMNDVKNGTHIVLNTTNIYCTSFIVKEDINEILKNI